MLLYRVKSATEELLKRGSNNMTTFVSGGTAVDRGVKLMHTVTEIKSIPCDSHALLRHIKIVLQHEVVSQLRNRQ